MAQVTLVAKPDEGRAVGRPSLLRAIGEEFNLKAQTIVEPSLKREIRKRLARTPRAHKFNADGKERSPAGSVGASEIGGSKTEKKTRVRVVQSKASGAGGGRGARGASYEVEATSLAQSRDRQVHTFGILVSGRKEKGYLSKPMSFWGRRGQEGRIRVRPWGQTKRFRPGVIPGIRYRRIKPDPGLVTRVFSPQVTKKLGEAFERAVTQILTRDGLRDYVGVWSARVDVR